MNTCQKCGTSLRDNSLGGLCPTCLVALARHVESNPAHGHAAYVPLTPAELQGRLPGLEIQACIGKGGMGAVYRALQTDLDRVVAVKILPERLAEDPSFVERFRREARALARLDHPNIVQVFGSGVSDGLCYIVMELVEGVTLREAMASKSVDPVAALKIIPQICGALEFAHANGVVHRDIKPENILLGSGKVKVADFGLAKLTDLEATQATLTHTGAALGTLRYMAPEQFDGATVDHRTDIYALGVVFYELLTGQVPMGHFPPPSHTPGVDPRIDAVVMRTLQREPADRYQYVSEIQAELETISQGGVVAPNKNRQHNIYNTASESQLPSARLRMMRNGTMQIGREWKTQATFLGYPLVHIAYGYDERTGQKLVARGVVAIGDVAVGGLAMGGVAIGLLAFGGVAMGLTSLGGAALGILAAYGGAAIGGLAMGGGAIGLIALGGGAIGIIAIGGGAIGNIVYGSTGNGFQNHTAEHVSNEAEIETWIGQFITSPTFGYWMTGGFAATILFPLSIVAAALTLGWLTSSNENKKPNPLPTELKFSIIHAAAMLFGLTLGLVFAGRTIINTTAKLGRTQAAEVTAVDQVPLQDTTFNAEK